MGLEKLSTVSTELVSPSPSTAATSVHQTGVRRRTLITIYHALPYGLTDALGRTLLPELYVDIGGVIEAKSRMLACRECQREWLDSSQGLGSHVETMKETSREVGRMSGVFGFAEGWRRRSRLGYSAAKRDPLAEALAGHVRPAAR